MLPATDLPPMVRTAPAASSMPFEPTVLSETTGGPAERPAERAGGPPGLAQSPAGGVNSRWRRGQSSPASAGDHRQARAPALAAHPARDHRCHQQPSSSAFSPALANVPGVIALAPSPDRAPLLPPDALHKLDRLYSLLPRLDPLLPLVPHLLSRLRSLAHLHTSADSFRARLDDALNGLRATSDRTAHLSKLLSTI
ncbi:hypothetical protein PtB15_7B91 [Puccinia triticina]|nr:hypothetical protein PtB15_7B91 [Puccinia triticina]